MWGGGRLSKKEDNLVERTPEDCFPDNMLEIVYYEDFLSHSWYLNGMTA